MQVGFRTDTGKARDSNEDAYLADYPLFAVADGMGGHAAGEVASKLAISVLEANKAKLVRSRKPLLLLEKIFELANRKIIEKSAEISAFGMGTTLTAALVINDKAYIGHAGDSRLYIANGPRLTQITNDHSLVQELVRAGSLSPDQAESHPNRNIITKALGIAPELKPDLLTINLKHGDKLLIVSDGITAMISDRQIVNSIIKDITPDEICYELITKANSKGGLDNSTAVIVTGILEKAPARNVLKGFPFVKVIELIFAMILAVGTLLFFLSGNFYVKLQDDKIALYQGHPVNIAGINFSRKLLEHGINRSDIPDWYIERLEAGVAVDSQAEGSKALDYVKSYSSTE